MSSRLTFLHKTKTNKHQCWMAMYQCECGTKKEILMSSVRAGNTKSCGCLQRETAKDTLIKTNTTHGKSKTEEYNIWLDMQRRCKSDSEKNYKGRGITVSKEWRDSFEQILNDMGKRPSKAYSVERIDNDKGYSASNCKWATLKEQANNKRTSRHIIYNGIKKTVAQWSDTTGLSKKMLYSRVERGWSADRIFSPSQPNGTNQHTSIRRQ